MSENLQKEHVHLEPKNVDFTRILDSFCKNKDFIIDDNNKYVVRQIIKYIDKDPSFNGDLKKGICVAGPKGVGKSILMKAMTMTFKGHEANTGYRHDVFTMDNIVSLAGYYSQKDQGDAIFNDLTKPNLNGRVNIRCCNDIGREMKESIYMGMREDVGARYIYSRYELWQDQKIKTHFTTNMVKAEEFEARYGDLNYDRMKEMCNFIFLNGPSRR